MAKASRKRSGKAGMMPGSLVYIGDKQDEKVSIRIIEYDQSELRDLKFASLDNCRALRESGRIGWIDIDGTHDLNIVERLGTLLEIHPLTMEDIVNTSQRPKYDDLGKYLFIVVKMLRMGEKTGVIESEQVSLVFGEKFLLSFRERPGDVFDSVGERLRKQATRTRFLGTDYLAYALLDIIVDNYFHILENLGERIEVLQDRLVDDPVKNDLDAIHKLKRELTHLRKSVWPLRDVAGGLERIDSPLFHDFTRPYLRDLYDHVIQVIDTVETYREMVSGLLDIYLSSVSNRMNEVMKVLTIIATIFIPLSFLAGIYGMNFDTSIGKLNMPELGWRYGYMFFWVVALITALGLIWYFRRRKWL